MEEGLDAVAFQIDEAGVPRQRHAGAFEAVMPGDGPEDSFAFQSLQTVLERQFGMPQIARHAKNSDAQPRVVAQPAALPDGPLQVTGVVVGPDEKPLVGARISPALVSAREKEITTGTTGAFSFTLDDVPSALILNVTAPGLAARTFWGHFINAVDFSAGRHPREMIIEQTGRITRPLRLETGVEITGRVIQNGKSAPLVTMVLRHPATVFHERNRSSFQRFLADVDAKTDEHGRFQFSHIAANESCSISVRAASLTNQQTIVTRRFDTGQDNSAVELGDFMVRPGLTVAGRVVFTDLKVPPPGTRLIIMPDNAGELFADVNETGRFELRGLPEGPVYGWVQLPQQGAGSPMVRSAYRLSHQNKCLDPTYPDRLQGTIHHDITDLTILLEPGDFQENVSLTMFGLDPAAVADFEEAKSGPITGVPPR
jgi:hypothetical protein